MAVAGDLPALENKAEYDAAEELRAVGRPARLHGVGH